jgi:hypothetical protein
MKFIENTGSDRVIDELCQIVMHPVLKWEGDYDSN